MAGIPRVTASVAAKLGHYVDVYVDLLDRRIFYVGKGKGGLALAHLTGRGSPEVARRIRQIRAAGRDPQIEILAHGLPSGDAALRVEAAVIDALGFTGLSNRIRGAARTRGGRAALPELIARYTRRPATIREPAILIRVNQEYRHGMSDSELYDATRGVWVVGSKREEAELALAVFEGVVREVYRITRWLPAGSTFNSRWAGRAIRAAGRFEFVGVIASERVRRRYVDRWVGHLFAKGAQNPITYVNVG